MGLGLGFFRYAENENENEKGARLAASEKLAVVSNCKMKLIYIEISCFSMLYSTFLPCRF